MAESVAVAVSAFVLMTQVTEAQIEAEPWLSAAITLGGALATFVAGLALAWRPLAVRPAQVLRAQE